MSLNENYYYTPITLEVYFVCDSCKSDNELTVQRDYGDTTLELECETCNATNIHEVEYDDYDNSCHCGTRCVC